MWTPLSLLTESITSVVSYKVHCTHRPGAGSWKTYHYFPLPWPLGSTFLTDVSSFCISKAWRGLLPPSGQDNIFLLTPFTQPCPGKTCSCLILSCSDLLLILCKSEALILPDMGSLVLQLDTYTPYFLYPNMLTACSSWTSSCWKSPQHSSSANTCDRSGKKATQTKAFCEKFISRMWDFCTAFA